MKAIDYWTCDKCGKRIYADPCEHCGGVEPSMHEELKAAIESAKAHRHTRGVAHIKPVKFLATYGDALIAAVELAEAADRYDSKDDALASTISSRRRDYARALEAYRAATQERRGS